MSADDASQTVRETALRYMWSRPLGLTSRWSSNAGAARPR